MILAHLHKKANVSVNGLKGCPSQRTFLKIACLILVASSHLLSSSSSLVGGNPPSGRPSSKMISTRFSPESEDLREPGND